MSSQVSLNGWRKRTLGELSTVITKGTTPGFADGGFTSAGVVFVKVESITSEGQFVRDKFEHIAHNTNQKLLRSQLQADDVLFTIAGTIGRVAQVTEDILPANTNQAVAIVRADKKAIRPTFLYYALRDDVQTRVAGSRVVQSVQANFSLGELRKLEIHLPPLEEQDRICHVLGAFDDKIKLSRKKSDTFEAMARSVFDSWFVDFDSIRGNGVHESEMPNGIDTLRSVIPTIPNGWNSLPLSSIIEVNPVRTLRRGTVAPYLDMANTPTRGHAPNGIVTREFRSGTKFINGDTLVARITPCLENGKTAFVDFLEDGQVGWGSTEFIVLAPKPPLPAEFGYCLARSEPFREFAINAMTGSSGRQRVPTESLDHFLLAVPKTDIAEEFGKFVRPIFQRLKFSAAENRTLTELRDVLLPGLISGELRIPDAERILENA